MRWLKEPLVHFLVLGAVIFALYSAIGPGGPAEDEIVVTRGKQESLLAAFDRTWSRPPTPEEYQVIVQEWIREEIAFREGVAMGLNEDDTIIRRRLRQKLEVLAEDIVSLGEPTEEILQSFLEDNQDDYLREPVFTVRQIYFSTDRRGASAIEDAAATRAALRANPETDPNTLGDPISLPQRLVRERAGAIDGLFGQGFTTALAEAPAGEWSEPVRSGYGVHLVLVEEFLPGGPLTLAEAGDEVRRDWNNQRRLQTIDTLYEKLAEQYTITIEPLAPESGEGP
ncbi:MAG: peptidylprolyl isomerase [Pseudomonadota bacterium]